MLIFPFSWLVLHSALLLFFNLNQGTPQKFFVIEVNGPTGVRITTAPEKHRNADGRFVLPVSKGESGELVWTVTEAKVLSTVGRFRYLNLLPLQILNRMQNG